MLHTIQACPQKSICKLYHCVPQLWKQSLVSVNEEHVQICITTPGESCPKHRVQIEWNSFQQQSVIKCQMYKSKSNWKPWCSDKNHKAQSKCQNQSTDITRPHPTTNPHSCNVKLKWPCATTQAHQHNYLVQNCKCDWRTINRDCLTASFKLPFCTDTLAHCWTTLQPWNLLRCYMHSAQRPNEECRPCCQHADLNHSIQVGHKGSLPNSAAKKDW